MNERAFRVAERELWEHFCGTGPREEVVDIPALRTKARVLLHGEGEPVLLVHGGPNAASTWASLAPHLPGRRLVLVDRPGCGLSPPVDYGQGSLQEVAAGILCGVVDGLGIDRVDIVGSSVGGSFALWFAQRHPARVRRIVQLSCPPFFPEMNLDAAIFLRLLGLPVLGVLLTWLPPSKQSIAQTLRAMGHRRLVDAGGPPAPVTKWMIALMKHTDTMKNDRRTVQKGFTFRAMRPEVVLRDEELAAIETPVHFFWGSEDPFGSVEAGRRLAATLPNGTFELFEGGGHLPWLDDAERAGAAILGALPEARRVAAAG